MLSDALNSCGGGVSEREVAILANGCLTAAHATQFAAYVRQVHSQYSLKRILNGEQHWPDRPEERDVLYFLAQSFRAQLLKELPGTAASPAERPRPCGPRSCWWS